MSTATLGLSEGLLAYVRSEMVAESASLRALREETDRLENREMRMSPEQGQVMALMVRLTGARRILEVGTFVGYSALWMAEALPADGRIVTCDIEPKYPEMGRPYWRQAGLEDRIEVRIGPALDTIAGLAAQGAEGTFDLAFIDADKERYADYYRACLGMVRPGGLVLVDNVFWDGRVADPADRSPDTEGIRRTTRLIAADCAAGLVHAATIAIGDGLTLVMKGR